MSIACAAFVLLVAGPAAGRNASDSELAVDAATIARHFDPRVAGTLPRIPDLGRRLLALRSYLRAGPTLPERWSWSELEICEFERTPEFRNAQAELDSAGLATPRACFDTGPLWELLASAGLSPAG